MFKKLVVKAYNLLDIPKRGIAKQAHFSFILRQNNLLCIGWNDTWKTSPIAKKYGYRFNCTHAELDAIRSFPYPPRLLRGCKMVNIRILKDGSVGMAKPCKRCRKLLRDFELKEVWFSTATRFQRLS